MKKLTKEQRDRKKDNWQKRLIAKGNSIKKNSTLCPRCIFEDQEITLSSEGYFSPCCWFDDELYRNQKHVGDLFQPHLNIENNDNIQDIFDSKEWQTLWEILLNRPEDAPPICYEYCADKKGDYEILKKEGDLISHIRKH